MRRTSGEAPELLKRLAPALAAIDHRLREVPRPQRPVPPLSSSDVSVVVQGPVVGGPEEPPELRYTVRCLRSVRQAMPDAEIILSTWRGSDLSDLDADRVVVSDDPGPTAPRDPTHVANNVNRQVVTTRAGLEQATRAVAIKLRSDMLMEHDGALRLFRGWPDRGEQFRILQERILVPTFYTFNPRRVYARFPYMVSDWYQVGLRDDLVEVWATPHWDPKFEWLLGRRIVASEQWIWMSFLNRHDADAFVGRRDVVEHSELALVNNAVVLEAEDLGVRMLKFTPHLGHQTAVYTHGEWRRLYTRHCQGGSVAGPDGQALLRAVVDRVWIRGLAPRIIGYPADMSPHPHPHVPRLTVDSATTERLPATGLR